MLENRLANESLEVARVRAETKQLNQTVQELEEEIKKRNDFLNKVQSQIRQANITVQRKQNHIDLLNRKLERLLKESGVSLFYAEIRFGA